MLLITIFTQQPTSFIPIKIDANFAAMNDTLLIIVLAILVIFLIIRNRKDEKEFEERFNEDYQKPKPHDVENEGQDSA
jgi:protein-S-isoprenylcysteine O-methyltransferase Ste14